MICKYCGSDKLVERLENGRTIHYSRIMCEECDRFQGWGKNPAKSEQFNEKTIFINDLLKHETQLTNWEIGFLTDIKQYRHLTEKQQARLDAIASKINVRVSA